jgi:hypothetical protein
VWRVLKSTGVALLAAVTLLIVLDFTILRSSSKGNYLANSVGNLGSLYWQHYHRGDVVFASGPQLDSSAPTPIRDVRTSMVVSGKCRPDVLYQLAFNSNSGSEGYTPGGDGPARRLIRLIGLGPGRSPTSIVLWPNEGSGWFDTFTFKIPSYCVLHISGYATTYNLKGTTYHEFLADPAVFLPLNDPPPSQ